METILLTFDDKIGSFDGLIFSSIFRLLYLICEKPSGGSASNDLTALAKSSSISNVDNEFRMAKSFLHFCLICLRESREDFGFVF